MSGTVAADARSSAAVLRVTGAEAAGRWAAGIAAVTRLGYAGSDPVPGLPVPDGARETAEDVVGALTTGSTAWLVLDAGGAPTTVLRVREHGASGWEIVRVATLPAVKRAGGARRLLAAVESAAAAAEVRRVWLSAVVERCLPPFYAWLGYHVTDNWPSPDKALSELTMERDPLRRPAGDPCPWWLHPRPDGSRVLCWFGAGTWLAAVPAELDAPLPMVVARAAAAAGGAPLAGVDLQRPGATPLEDTLAAAGGQRPGGSTRAWVFAASRTSVPLHLEPRRADPRLLAYWRLRPGRELPPTDLRPVAPPRRSEDHG